VQIWINAGVAKTAYIAPGGLRENGFVASPTSTRGAAATHEPTFRPDHSVGPTNQRALLDDHFDCRFSHGCGTRSTSLKSCRSVGLKLC
jgi:hypothetical protein